MGDYGPIQARPGPSGALAMASPPPLPNPQFALVRPPDVVEQQRGAGLPVRMPPAVASSAVAANPVMHQQPDVIQDSRLEKQPSPLYMNEEEAAAKVKEEEQPTYMNEDQDTLRGRSSSCSFVRKRPLLPNRGTTVIRFGVLKCTY